MIIASRFELLNLWRFIVFFIGGMGRYFCLVYDTLMETFPIQKRTVFNSAAAWVMYGIQYIVHKAAEVTTNITYKEYYGKSEGELKSRYNNHTQPFRYISHINDTELCKYLWTLKANGTI